MVQQLDAPLVMLDLEIPPSGHSLRDHLVSTKVNSLPFAIPSNEGITSKINRAHRLNVTNLSEGNAKEIEKEQAKTIQQ